MALTTSGTASTQFTDAMKTFYLGPLNDQIYKASVLLDRLEKNGEDVSGNHAHIPLISARNPGVGSRKDTAGTGPTLPAVGSQGYDAATFLMAMHYGRGGVSGPVMRASKNSSGAFAKALDVEMKGLTNRLPEDLNRQLWSYGHGRAGTIQVNTGGSTMIELSSHSVMSLRVGDRIHAADITAGGSFSPAAGTTVVAINRDQDSALAASTISHAIETAAVITGTVGEDAIYFGGGGTLAAVDVSRAQEMYGIPAVVDNGAIGADEGSAAETGELLDGSLSLGGIDRTSGNVFWQATMLTNPTSAGTNRALTVGSMEEAFLTGMTVGGAMPSDVEMYSNPGLWATFGLLHIGDRVFNDFKETLEGGWIALKFNSRPFFYDRDCPRDKIWFLDMSTLVLLTQSGYEFMDDDGAILSRQSNVDAYEFTLYRDIQLGLNNALKNVVLDDVSSSFNVEANV